MKPDPTRGHRMDTPWISTEQKLTAFLTPGTTPREHVLVTQPMGMAHLLCPWVGRQGLLSFGQPVAYPCWSVSSEPAAGMRSTIIELRS